MSRELTKCHFQSIESTISINSAWTYLIQVLNAKKPGTKNSPAILLGLILIQVLDSTKSRHSTELTKCQIQSIESTISINSTWTYLIQVSNSKEPGAKNSPAILLGLILIQVLDSKKS